MITIEEFSSRFSDEPGYLDFARVGPVGQTVRAEDAAQHSLLGRARFGTLDSLTEQDLRVRESIAAITGFRADQIQFQPNTSQGLMHAMFGITGDVAVSPGEFPAITFAVDRAAAALHSVAPVWLETDHGRVTPGNLRDQLSSSVVAVAVSLVDFRTGYLADLEGIRQVIGDRLLIVDAIQGFAVVDAPYELADVVVSGGQKWARAGFGTGFIALSERAVDRLTPVFSGFSGTDAEGIPLDEIMPPTHGVRAFQVSNSDPVAQARLAAALEEIADVGVAEIAAVVAERVSEIIDLADEFGVPVVSSRDERERAGIIVLEPPADQLTVLSASLYNHGVTATTRQGRVRLSAHVTTDADTVTMLRSAFTSFGAAVSV